LYAWRATTIGCVWVGVCASYVSVAPCEVRAPCCLQPIWLFRAGSWPSNDCNLCVQALGLSLGVFHVELKQTSRGPRLIEINCRMGGGPVRFVGVAPACPSEHVCACAHVRTCMCFLHTSQEGLCACVCVCQPCCAFLPLEMPACRAPFVTKWPHVALSCLSDKMAARGP